MTAFTADGVRFPLLESLLAERGIGARGIYTIPDVAAMFNVGRRAIQAWIHDGRLPARNLPGRGRFLSEDLEQFLQQSSMKATRTASNNRLKKASQ